MELIAYDAPAVRQLLAQWQAELLVEDPSFATATGSAVHDGDFDPPHGVFLLARDATGAPCACGGMRRVDAGTAEIKRLYVHPGARGQGIGGALLRELEQRARGKGYRRLRLDTGGHAPALGLFNAAGFHEIADYNGNPRARHWFEKRL